MQMAQLWLPGAERRPENNGGSMAGGPPRSIWHITWDSLGPGGKQPAFDNIAGYLQSVNFCPHLMWDPWTGKTVQFYAANESARAVANASGGVETNRMGSACIQVETFFTPGAVRNGKKYMTVADTPCIGLDKIVDWMRGWGIPDVWPSGWPQWNGSPRNVSNWLHKAGHYGHCHVPENDHTDPGPMPKDMFQPVKPIPAPIPTPTPTPVEDDVPYGQLAEGPKAITPVALPKGRYKTIGFIADNGLQGLPPAQLRVAVNHGPGLWKVDVVTVDSSKAQAVVTFTDQPNTVGISIRREDAGDAHVAWEVS